MGLGWRRLGASDSAAAAALLVEAHARSRALGVDFPAARANADDVASALAAGVALMAAASPDGPPVAMGALWPDGEIGWLAVAEGMAGRGLGNACLLALEGLALALGHERVYLRTASAHPWLAAWYRRHGYADAAGAGGGCDLRLVRDLGTWRPAVRARCAWSESDARMAAYHDYEWGLWVESERDLFERLSLEVFQTGLSWRTVLTKRAALREGILGFEPLRLEAAGDAEEARFLAADGVIRSPQKFRAIVHNAAAVRALAASHGSFARFLRGCAADNLYAELRPRLRYLGPTVARSFFESVGLVPAPHGGGCPDAQVPCAGIEA